MVKVVLVDDHPVFRQGLIRVLEQVPEFQVIGEAGSGRDLMSQVAELNPDLVIMDVLLAGDDGIEATARLHEKFPKVKVLILSICDSRNDLVRAVGAGAVGYVLKGTELPELIDSIRLVSKGGAVFSPPMATSLTLELIENTRIGIGPEELRLSNREREVLQLAAQGATNKEIAQQCYISETTVKAHFRNILEKLHTKNRSSAVAVAVKKGLLKYTKWPS
jgi:two-component system response regulator DegU